MLHAVLKKRYCLQFGCGLSIFFVIIFIFLRLPITYLSFNESIYKHSYENKRVLFVTAHPDDEVVFFGPTVNSLRRIIGAENIFLLAMTNGNYEGKGRTREKELEKGFKVLNLNPENIYFYKRENPLNDHPRRHLPLKEMAKGVSQYIERLKIDLIISFDEGGVSHHINHGDVFRALDCCWPKIVKPPAMMVLETVNLVRKHSSIIDIFASIFIDAVYYKKLVFISGPDDVRRTKALSHAHFAQLNHIGTKDWSFTLIDQGKSINATRTKESFWQHRLGAFVPYGLYERKVVWDNA